MIPPLSQDPITLVLEYKATWLLPYDLRELKTLLTHMLRAANATHRGSQIAGIELTLVTDATIALVNARELGCTGPTNILSFPGGEDFPGSLLLSLDTYDHECILYGQDREKHLLHLLAHGIAHLAALDHGPDHDAIHDACMIAGKKYSAF